MVGSKKIRAGSRQHVGQRCPASGSPGQLLAERAMITRKTMTTKPATAVLHKIFDKLFGLLLLSAIIFSSIRNFPPKENSLR
ncbi:MAG: hypothetical protein ACLR6B_06480 [Blautia sp.]